MSKTLKFRKIALDRLASADDLDRVLQVTGLRSWILLTALCTLAGTAVTWSAVAVVPQKVMGSGILLKSGGIFGVVAPVSGRVTDVSASAGDTVKEGQVVARIAQPELMEKLQDARIRLSNVQQAYDMLVRIGNRELQMQAQTLQQQASNLKEAIAADELRAKYLAEKVASQQQLVSEGRLVRQALINSITERERAHEQIRSRRTELTEIELKTMQAKSALDLGVQKSSFAVLEGKNEVAQLERALTSGAEVRSAYTGRIVELSTEQGEIVERGESLFTLDLTGRTVAGLEALLYVPAKDGKRIEPGMVVQIAPATVRPEEYGYLLGKVTYVSESAGDLARPDARAEERSAGQEPVGRRTAARGPRRSAPGLAQQERLSVVVAGRPADQDPERHPGRRRDHRRVAQADRDGRALLPQVLADVSGS